MRYALIKNGEVTNTIEWDGGPHWYPPDGYVAVQHDYACIGWKHDGRKFIIPEPPKTEEIRRIDPLREVLIKKGLITEAELASMEKT